MTDGQYSLCKSLLAMRPAPITTKLSRLKAKAAAGDWNGAILIAARFPDLGAHRDAILSAREAINRPAFQRQLNRDPQTLIAAGIAALRDKYRL